MAKNIATKSGLKTVAKTVVFDPEAWNVFEERTRQVGGSPSAFFRKVVTDYLDGRYIHLDTAPAALVEELHKRREELRLTALQPVIDIVFAEWLDARKKKKTK